MLISPVFEMDLLKVDACDGRFDLEGVLSLSLQPQSRRNSYLSGPICVCFNRDTVIPDFRNSFCDYSVIAHLLTSALTPHASRNVIIYCIPHFKFQRQSDVFEKKTCICCRVCLLFTLNVFMLNKNNVLTK